MNWIKENYDKAALLLAAIALAAGAVLIYLSSQSFAEEFSERDSRKKPDHTIPELPVAAVKNAIEVANNPTPWRVYENGGSLFVGEPYVVRDGKLINPLHGEENIHEPIPNQWLHDYQLDYVRADLPNLDPDNDGFTVLEEYLGGTDPTSPKSVPPYHLKLRLQEYISIPFRLKFTGSPDQGTTFSINTVDVKQPTQFVELGEQIKGTPFKVVKYEPDEEIDQGIVKDVSKLILENVEKGGSVTLINQKVIDSPTSKAKVINLLDGGIIEVTKDEFFTLPQDPETRYKLIDITNEKAVIQDPAGKQFDVPKADEQSADSQTSFPESP